MKYYIIILLFFNSLILLGQSDTVFIKRAKINIEGISLLEYRVDTFIYKSQYDRRILIGTSVLNSTKTYEAYNNYGLLLKKVEASNCLKGEKNFENRITEINKTDTLLIVEINIYDNCGYAFLCEIEVVDNKRLNLIAKGYGIHYSCNCSYSLKYYIKNIDLNDSYDINEYMINGVKMDFKN